MVIHMSMAHRSPMTLDEFLAWERRQEFLILNPACTTPVTDGMTVTTQSRTVRKAQDAYRFVLEVDGVSESGYAYGIDYMPSGEKAPR